LRNLFFGHGLDEFSSDAVGQLQVLVLDNKSYRTDLQKVSEKPIDGYQFRNIV